MKAWAIDSYGGPARLTQRDLPTPTVGDHDLLIRVRAASVNPVDHKIREGAIKVLVKDRFPLILGSDLSGVIEQIGGKVTRFAVGDEVFVRLPKDRIGAFAELAACHEDAAAKKPRALSHVEAASIPLVGLTAWQALVEIGHLAAGQRVLIHAGSGGVGTFAIQLAKHLGAHVATTVGQRNAALVRKLGAETIIDYKTERFEAKVTEQDVILDTQGGETLLRSFHAVKRGGVVVTVGGNPDGAFAKKYGLNFMLVAVLSLLARKITKAAKQHDAKFEYLFMRADGEQLTKIGKLLDSKQIVPVLDKTFGFDKTPDAMAYVESGRSVGKVVIEMV